MNLNTLHYKIALLLFMKKANIDFFDLLVLLNESKNLLPGLFDDYQWRSLRLSQSCFYDYFKLVSIDSNKIDKSILSII